MKHYVFTFAPWWLRDTLSECRLLLRPWGSYTSWTCPCGDYFQSVAKQAQGLPEQKLIHYIIILGYLKVVGPKILGILDSFAHLFLTVTLRFVFTMYDCPGRRLKSGQGFSGDRKETLASRKLHLTPICRQFHKHFTYEFFVRTSFRQLFLRTCN